MLRGNSVLSFFVSWEQRKLNELTNIITKGTTPLDKVNEGTINFIKIENIDSFSGNINITSKITEEEHNSYLKRSQLKENDLLFSIAGTLGRVTVVKSDVLPANTNQALAIIRLKDGDINYIKTYLKGKTISNFIKRNPTIGAQPNLSLEQVGNFDIDMPNKEEQRKLGNLFNSIDNLITLHQSKYDKLVNVKKALLEKMFPKDGKNVPEIRFKGFTDTWEQHKFSRLANVRRGLTYSPIDISKNGVRVLRSSNIQEDKFIYSEDDVFVNKNAINIDYVKNNDILITSANGSTRLVGKHALISGLPSSSAVHGGFMLLATANENPEFLNASMSSSWYSKFIELFVSGGNGAIGNLSKSDLDEQEILVPSSEEQKKLGQLFKMIDNLITLHQHKLEKLKNMKKSLLNKMFI